MLPHFPTHWICPAQCACIPHRLRHVLRYQRQRRAPQERGQELDENRTAVVDTNIMDEPEIADRDATELRIDHACDGLRGSVERESRRGVVHRTPLMAIESTSSDRRTHSVSSHAERD